MSRDVTALEAKAKELRRDIVKMKEKLFGNFWRKDRKY